MKLGIVIPLKSKCISKDWEITTRSLSATLNSIQHQTSPLFSVAVAGHQVPTDMVENYPNVRFVSVDFPVPDPSAPNFSHKRLIDDKNMKLAHAMLALADSDITHWYALDSDDLVSTDFVETVLQSVSGYSGALLEGGYFLYHDIKRAIRTEEMTQYCGSTSVLADEDIEIPRVPSLENIKSIPWSNYSHMNISEFFTRETQKPFTIIKKPILGYVLSSGDNISDRWRDNWWKVAKAKIKPFIKGKKYSPSLLQSFSMNNLK